MKMSKKRNFHTFVDSIDWIRGCENQRFWAHRIQWIWELSGRDVSREAHDKMLYQSRHHPSWSVSMNADDMYHDNADKRLLRKTREWYPKDRQAVLVDLGKRSAGTYQSPHFGTFHTKIFQNTKSKISVNSIIIMGKIKYKKQQMLDRSTKNKIQPNTKLIIRQYHFLHSCTSENVSSMNQSVKYLRCCFNDFMLIFCQRI